MDNQNFNDQELSDIMKEIESLEEEFAPSKAKATPELTELAQMEVEQSVPKKAPQKKQEAEVYPFEAKSKPHSSMSFKVEGQMKIDLQFEIGGKVVGIEVSETGLSIQMEGGVTFNVPVDAQKKSA